MGGKGGEGTRKDGSGAAWHGCDCCGVPPSLSPSSERLESRTKKKVGRGVRSGKDRERGERSGSAADLISVQRSSDSCCCCGAGSSAPCMYQ